MAEIGLRSGMVRPGIYSLGPYQIEKICGKWVVFGGNPWRQYGEPHKTLGDAKRWARANINI